jgi:hypothetical protein
VKVLGPGDRKLLKEKAKLKKGLENELKARGLASAAGYD